MLMTHLIRCARPALALPGALLLAMATLAACSRAPGDGPAARADGSAAAAGTPEQAGQPAAPPVVLSAAAEPATSAPGATFTLLWTFRPAPGWHLYGNVRNDSGFAPRQRLELPTGWEAGPLQWPAPARHVSAGDILDHVYEGELVLLQDIRVPSGVAPGRRELRAHWEWLACRDVCVPGRDSLSVAITVAPGGTSAAAPTDRLAAARSRLPQPMPADLVQVVMDGQTARITRTDGGAGNLAFVPALDCGELADLLREGVGTALSLRLLPADGRVGPLRGLLLVEGAGPGAYTLDVPSVPWTGNPTVSKPAGG
jgi:DsbC/DsbD-like thiol-disulfide interchange protein